MAQANFSVRLDESLKRQFDALCSDFGRWTECFPSIAGGSPKNGIQDLTLEEIDEEFQRTRHGKVTE